MTPSSALRHRFILVATAAKHDDVLALQHAIEEAVDESALLPMPDGPCT